MAFVAKRDVACTSARSVRFVFSASRSRGLFGCDDVQAAGFLVVACGARGETFGAIVVDYGTRIVAASESVIDYGARIVAASESVQAAGFLPRARGELVLLIRRNEHKAGGT